MRRLRDAPPYVTGALVAPNLVVYVITGLQSHSGLLGDQSNATRTACSTDGSCSRRRCTTASTGELLTSAFLHVNPLHIAANMLALVVIGPSLEAVLGRWRYLAVYLLAAFGGSAAVYAFGAPGVPVVGASGAIFGLFGASLVMVRRLGLDPQWLIGVIVLNFVFTFSVPSISKLGHLGGFVAGAAGRRRDRRPATAARSGSARASRSLGLSGASGRAARGHRSCAPRRSSRAARVGTRSTIAATASGRRPSARRLSTISCSPASISRVTLRRP